MYSYGKIYSKLSIESMKSVNPIIKNRTYYWLMKTYFQIFGYPDVAGQMRFKIVEKLVKLKHGETVLDAGCGNGIYLQEFGKEFGTIGLGIDARIDRVRIARKINSDLHGNNQFKASTLEKSDAGNSKFDKVICLEVLEHIKEDFVVVKKLSNFLKKQGLLVISVPIKGTALSKKEINNPNFKPEKFGHVRSGYNINEIKSIAKNANLKIVIVKKYFFIVSRYTVKLQQYIYKKNLLIINLILSPLLLAISTLDNIIKIYPRGYIVVMRRK